MSWLRMKSNSLQLQTNTEKKLGFLWQEYVKKYFLVFPSCDRYESGDCMIRQYISRSWSVNIIVALIANCSWDTNRARPNDTKNESSFHALYIRSMSWVFNVWAECVQPYDYAFLSWFATQDESWISFCLSTRVADVLRVSVFVPLQPLLNLALFIARL